MLTPSKFIRSVTVIFSVNIFMLALVGCGGGAGSRSNKLDGVYHGGPGSPITLTIKNGKATMTIGNESKTLDYKVEGNKLTLLDPKEGNAVYTINDDGTLNSEIGVLTKSPS